MDAQPSKVKKVMKKHSNVRSSQFFFQITSNPILFMPKMIRDLDLDRVEMTLLFSYSTQ